MFETSLLPNPASLLGAPIAGFSVAQQRANLFELEPLVQLH
jgi:hypothetical protein